MYSQRPQVACLLSITLMAHLLWHSWLRLCWTSLWTQRTQTYSHPGTFAWFVPSALRVSSLDLCTSGSLSLSQFHIKDQTPTLTPLTKVVTIHGHLSFYPVHPQLSETISFSCLLVHSLVLFLPWLEHKFRRGMDFVILTSVFPVPRIIQGIFNFLLPRHHSPIWFTPASSSKWESDCSFLNYF